MSQEWGRAEGAGTWPRPKPVWTLALLLVAIVSGGAIGAHRYTTAWTPLQRLFLSPYLRSQIASALAFKTGRYRLLQVVDRKGSRLPLDEEVQPVMTATDARASRTRRHRRVGPAGEQPGTWAIAHSTGSASASRRTPTRRRSTTSAPPRRELAPDAPDRRDSAFRAMPVDDRRTSCGAFPPLRTCARFDTVLALAHPRRCPTAVEAGKAGATGTRAREAQ